MSKKETLEKVIDEPLFDTAIQRVAEQVKGWELYDVAKIEPLAAYPSYPASRMFYVDLLDSENEVVSSVEIFVDEHAGKAEVTYE